MKLRSDTYLIYFKHLLMMLFLHTLQDQDGQNINTFHLLFYLNIELV